MAKPKNRRKLIIISAIGLVLVTLILLVIFKKREPVITIQTDKVARHSLTNIVVANGKIQPVVQVTISPEVSGEIIELPVKEGQQIKKGDLLVKINPDIYVAAVNQAKANYESVARRQSLGGGEPGKSPGGLRPQFGIVPPEAAFGIGFHRIQIRPRRGPGAARQRRRPGERGQGHSWTARRIR